MLDDYKLHTLLCEVEAVVNGRPLTPASDDPTDLDVLTPSHFLTPMRSSATLPPTTSSKHDEHGDRWRYVQHLADKFWAR